MNRRDLTMSRRKLRLALVCLLSVALLLALSIEVLPQTQTGVEETLYDGETVTVEASEAEQKAALEMWATREQREAVQPLPWAEVSPEELKGVAEEPTGKPGIAPGGSPDPQANIVAQMEFPEEWQGLLEELDAEEAAVAPQGTAAIYTSFRTNYYTQMWKYFPYRAVGKLYFKDSGGGSHYCTACVISDGTSKNGYRDIIVTAGHCMYDRTAKRWYNSWVFYPAYRNGAAPYGSFAYYSGRVLTAYKTTGARRYDVAVLSLKNNSAGKEVTYYTGYAGRSWNQGYNQLHFTLGYPSNLSTGTLYSWTCVAESFSGGTDVLGMGCDMTYGSSGGPWIRWFKPYQSGANNYVNSVVSGGTPGTYTFYGARFSSSNIVPLCTDEGC